MKQEEEQVSRHDGLRVKLFFHSLLYVSGWCLYAIYLVPLAFTDRGESPCEATPSQDFARSIWLLLAYLLLFSAWFFRIGRQLKIRKGRLLILSVILAILPYFIAGALAIVLYEDITRNMLASWGLFSWFYTYGCYHDVEVKEQAIFILTALLLLPLLYTILSYLNSKRSSISIKKAL